MHALRVSDGRCEHAAFSESATVRAKPDLPATLPAYLDMRYTSRARNQKGQAGAWLCLTGRPWICGASKACVQGGMGAKHVEGRAYHARWGTARGVQHVMC